MYFSCTKHDAVRTNYVFDREGDFTDSQKAVLNKSIVAHEKKTSNEIAIVTTPDWGDQENSMTFASDFGDANGIGKKGKDNGIVIVFSRKQKEIWLGTGYGTEAVLTDKLAKKMVDSVFIPQFRKGDYFNGIKNGLDSIIHFLELPGNDITKSTRVKK